MGIKTVGKLGKDEIGIDEVGSYQFVEGTYRSVGHFKCCTRSEDSNLSAKFTQSDQSLRFAVSPAISPGY